jgi:hypothetical protein
MDYTSAEEDGVFLGRNGKLVAIRQNEERLIVPFLLEQMKNFY